MSALNPVLRPAPGELLESIFSTGTVHDDQGVAYPLIDALSPLHAAAVHNTVVKMKPKVAVEVGLAYGVSALAILSGLHDLGSDGRLVSIDPMQTGHYHGVGVANVKRCGMSERHQFLEQPDYTALPDLLQRGTRVDFAYIDGWHTFDYTLLDFFFIDKMMNVGGVVAFNDCYMVGINKVIRYLQTHRDYTEIDVGLRPLYGTVWRGQLPLSRAIRRALDIRDNDRYFRKNSDREPPWNFYPRSPRWFLA